MPIVFLFSAIVSGIALVLLLYYLDHACWRRKTAGHGLPQQAGVVPPLSR